MVSTGSSRGVPLGRYLLGERLATGGMGEVFLAVQLGLGDFEKPLALKLLLPHLSEEPQAVEMFLHEANLAARMNHPNVVHIFDVGIETGRYYIAMELVRGVTLSKLLRGLEQKQRKLPPELLTYIAHGLLDGLHHAHELVGRDGEKLDIVHRDVSPQNLLLSLDGEVKLADFGIAKARDTVGHTRPGHLKGKLEYLAPEQFDGQSADRRSDVYAAAITLFHMATLSSPFHRDSDAATMKAVMTEPLPSVRTTRPDLPPELDTALRAAAARELKDRTPSALALREAIPALHDASAPKLLGQLLEEVCGDAMQKLDAQTAFTVHLRANWTQTSPEPLTRPAPSRRSLVAFGLLALAGLGFAAWRVGPFRADETQPTPVPVAAAVPPKVEPVPDAGVPALAVADPPPVKRTSARTTPAAAPKKHVRGVGYLTVDAVPWASVFVRGQKIGDTPIHAFPLDEGDVSVVLKNPETGKTVTRRVKVVATKQALLKVDLQ